MKNIAIIGIVLFGMNSFAVTQSQEYVFKYTLGNHKLEVKRTHISYEKAFELAAQDCFKHFLKGSQLSEEKGLDIIDVCANPRS